MPTLAEIEDAAALVKYRRGIAEKSAECAEEAIQVRDADWDLYVAATDQYTQMCKELAGMGTSRLVRF